MDVIGCNSVRQGIIKGGDMCHCGYDCDFTYGSAFQCTCECHRDSGYVDYVNEEVIAMKAVEEFIHDNN